MPQTAPRDNWTYALGAFGALTLANAVWMLVAPEHWYLRLPGNVPDFGEFNRHFVRDIGSTFFALGAGLVWAAARPAVRLPVLVIVTLFNAAHSVVHVFDTVTGYVDATHWVQDVPGVYLPTVVLAAMTVALARGPRGNP